MHSVRMLALHAEPAVRVRYSPVLLTRPPTASTLSPAPQCLRKHAGRGGHRSRQEISCARHQKKAPRRPPAPHAHRPRTLARGPRHTPHAAVRRYLRTPCGPAPSAADPVRLDPGYQQAPFEGWGTSLAWFANVTGGWPDAQRNRLADALYGAEGLGFTIARYNIGGGDSPETEPYMRAGAAVPGHWSLLGPGRPTPGTRTTPITGTRTPTATSAGGSRRPRPGAPTPSRRSRTPRRTS